VGTSKYLEVQGTIQKEKATGVILLMAEILHQLIGRVSHYLQGFLNPRWCRISSINSIAIKTNKTHSQNTYTTLPKICHLSISC